MLYFWSAKPYLLGIQIIPLLDKITHVLFS